jgi:hypothetical protein
LTILERRQCNDDQKSDEKNGRNLQVQKLLLIFSVRFLSKQKEPGHEIAGLFSVISLTE